MSVIVAREDLRPARPRRRPAIVAGRQRLAVAQERGELRSDIDIQAMIDMLWGAPYYRLPPSQM